jgi:hypothetical protein
MASTTIFKSQEEMCIPEELVLPLFPSSFHFLFASCAFSKIVLPSPRCLWLLLCATIGPHAYFFLVFASFTASSPFPLFSAFILVVISSSLLSVSSFLPLSFSAVSSFVVSVHSYP